MSAAKPAKAKWQSPLIEQGLCGFGRTPHIIDEAIRAFARTLTEMRVLSLLARETYGWNRPDAMLRVDYIADQLGASRGHVSETLAGLIDDAVILCRGDRRRGRPTAEQARPRYSINERLADWKIVQIGRLPSVEKFAPANIKTTENSASANNKRDGKCSVAPEKMFALAGILGGHTEHFVPRAPRRVAVPATPKEKTIERNHNKAVASSAHARARKTISTTTADKELVILETWGLPWAEVEKLFTAHQVPGTGRGWSALRRSLVKTGNYLCDSGVSAEGIQNGSIAEWLRWGLKHTQEELNLKKESLGSVVSVAAVHLAKVVATQLHAQLARAREQELAEQKATRAEQHSANGCRPKPPRCQAATNNGQPCQGFAPRNPEADQRFCWAHQPDPDREARRERQADRQAEQERARITRALCNAAIAATARPPDDPTPDRCRAISHKTGQRCIAICREDPNLCKNHLRSVEAARRKL